MQAAVEQALYFEWSCVDGQVGIVYSTVRRLAQLPERSRPLLEMQANRRRSTRALWLSITNRTWRGWCVDTTPTKVIYMY